MKSSLWIIAGCVAAVIGAAIWAAVAYYAHFEIGWIAWIIGAMVGGAVFATAGDQAGMMTGVGAAVIAIAGVVGGKYVSIRMELNQIGSDEGWAEVSDEFIISYIADEVALRRTEAGEELEWPGEGAGDEAFEEADYPTDVWAEALQQWTDADQAWRDQYRTYVEYQTKEHLAAFKNEVSELALIEGIGIFDIIFFLLAIVSAWKIGSGGGD